MTFLKFYGERALYIQKFTAFCSALTKVCEFGLNDVIPTNLRSIFPLGFLVFNKFFQSNISSMQTNKQKVDVKNNLSPIHDLEKKLIEIVFFSQKLQFRYFLKQSCSFAYCSSFHALIFFFILLHRNFNVTQQIVILCIILEYTLS